MSAGAHARLLPDGRVHLQHGPIDLIVEALAFDDGSVRATIPVLPHAGVLAAGEPPSTHQGRASFEAPLRRAPQDENVRRMAAHLALPPATQAAHAAAIARFATILDELCAELPLLRQQARPDGTSLRGAVARRMWAAVAPYAGDTFITPMAAVAGAVADEVLAALTDAVVLRRASVNNGGDIALHLAPGEQTRIGLVDRPDRPALFGTTTLTAGDGVGGIATSGWRGRSFSLGIADAVTILARSAAEADAAATIVANAVDLPGHPAIRCVPAREVQCDSDLGERLVTRDVGRLTACEIETALASGLSNAEALATRGLLTGAALHVQGATAATGIIWSEQMFERLAEERHGAVRLEPRANLVACFEMRATGPHLSMTPLEVEDVAA